MIRKPASGGYRLYSRKKDVRTGGRKKPWLLRIGVAGDRALEAREERAQGVATQRVPEGAAPAPPGESSANF